MGSRCEPQFLSATQARQQAPAPPVAAFLRVARCFVIADQHALHSQPIIGPAKVLAECLSLHAIDKRAIIASRASVVFLNDGTRAFLLWSIYRTRLINFQIGQPERKQVARCQTVSECHNREIMGSAIGQKVYNGRLYFF